MKTAIRGALLLVALLFAVPATAQQALLEAEILRTVPYSTMLRKDPTITYDDYRAAVRELARQQARQELLTPDLSLGSAAAHVSSCGYYTAFGLHAASDLHFATVFRFDLRLAVRQPLSVGP